MNPRIVDALARAPLFATMPEDERAQLATMAVLEEHEEGEILIAEGETGEDLFLIAAGRVGVSVRVRGRSRHVASLGPGEVFGEMSAMSDHRRHASVVSLEATTVVRLPRPGLEILLEDHPLVRAKLESLGAERFVEDIDLELLRE